MDNKYFKCFLHNDVINYVTCTDSGCIGEEVISYLEVSEEEYYYNTTVKSQTLSNYFSFNTKIATIRNENKELRKKGFIYNGIEFQTDSASISYMTAKTVLISGSDDSIIVNWKSSNNSIVEFTKFDFINFVTAASEYVEAMVFNKCDDTVEMNFSGDIEIGSDAYIDQYNNVVSSSDVCQSIGTVLEINYTDNTVIIKPK